MLIATFGLSAALAAALLAASPAVAAPLSGSWAGDRISLTTNPNGARIIADCADGYINGPLSPDDGGQFSAMGSFAVHQPGPQLADEVAPAPMTRFDGRLNGNRLTLTITDPDGTRRSFDLVRDHHLKPLRCL